MDPRHLIRPPYAICPVCGAEGLGVLQIHPHHALRRCRVCLGPHPRHPLATVTLPEVRKRILYLDQFALSNAMYRAFPKIDTARHARTGHWQEFFSKVHVLVRVQALVCPTSELHVNEGLPFENARDLQRTWTMLSCNTRFEDTATIERRQLVRCAELWDSRQPLEPDQILIDSVVSPDPNGWSDVLHVVIGLDIYDGIRDVIAESRARVATSLRPLFERWSTEPVHFDEQLTVELTGFGRAILQAARNYDAAAANFLSGEGTLPFQPPAVQLLGALQSKFRRMGHEGTNAKIRTVEFLLSDAPHASPNVRLNALLFAALARKLGAGMKPAKLNAGLRTDIKAVSAYLPYCDGILVDGLVAGLLSEHPLVDVVSSHHTQVFSARDLSRLIKWLDTVAAEIRPSHLATVKSVYGPGLVSTFERTFARVPT